MGNFYEIHNNLFLENLEEYSEQLNLDYKFLYEVYKDYMPFVTNYDYFYFAYRNFHSQKYSYFYILLFICSLNIYDFFSDDLINTQRKITIDFISLAPNDTKQVALEKLYDAFSQINKTKLLDNKKFLSFSALLSNTEKVSQDVPQTGDFYISWDKITFADGFFFYMSPQTFT